MDHAEDPQDIIAMTAAGEYSGIVTFTEQTWLGNPTGTIVRMVTIPMCPDLLRYDQLGEADNLRGRVVRAFFWIMRVWRV